MVAQAGLLSDARDRRLMLPPFKSDYLKKPQFHTALYIHHKTDTSHTLILLTEKKNQNRCEETT